MIAHAGVLLTFAMFMAGGAAMSAETEAGALECMVTSEFYGRGPEGQGSGSDALFGDDTSMGNQGYPSATEAEDPDGLGRTYTQYEATGVQGARWTTTEKLAHPNLEDNDCMAMGEITTAGAQIVFDIARITTSGTIWLRQHATDAEPFLDMIANATADISQLRAMLFIPGAGVMLGLTAFWVMGKSNARHSREVMVGVGMSMLMIITTAWLLNGGGEAPDMDHCRGDNVVDDPACDQPTEPNYLAVTRNVNEATTQMLGDVADAALRDEGTDVCRLDSDAQNRGQKMLDCTIYQTLVFQPWAIGQFGEEGQGRIPVQSIPPNAQGMDPEQQQNVQQFNEEVASDPQADLRTQFLRAQAVSVAQQQEGQGLRLGGRTADNFAYDSRYGQWNLLRRSMAEEAQGDHGGNQWSTIYPTWRGEDGGNRLSMAFGALVASVLVGLFVAATSLLTMLWNAVPVLLMLALVFVGTLAIFPPLQKHFYTWGQMWLKSMILALVFGIGQILALMAVSGVLTSQQWPVGVKALMMAVMVAALWKLMQAARQDAFTPNLGGSNAMDPDRAVSEAKQTGSRVIHSGPGRATGRVGRTAAAATAGGLAGGVTGAAKGGAGRVQDARTEHAEDSRGRRWGHTTAAAVSGTLKGGVGGGARGTDQGMRSGSSKHKKTRQALSEATQAGNEAGRTAGEQTQEAGRKDWKRWSRNGGRGQGGTVMPHRKDREFWANKPENDAAAEQARAKEARDGEVQQAMEKNERLRRAAKSGTSSTAMPSRPTNQDAQSNGDNSEAPSRPNPGRSGEDRVDSERDPETPRNSGQPRHGHSSSEEVSARAAGGGNSDELNVDAERESRKLRETTRQMTGAIKSQGERTQRDLQNTTEKNREKQVERDRKQAEQDRQRANSGEDRPADKPPRGGRVKRDED